MTKGHGMGDNFYVGGYDLSADIASLENIHGGPAALPGTDITMSAMARLGGLRDGGFSFTSYFDDAAGQAHPRLSVLPTADVTACYFRGTAVGNQAAACIGKQINYDPKRAADGSLMIGVDIQANGFGLEWGQQLTAGKRTDTGATNGASIDTAASVSFGAQAYLQVFAFTGTDVTVKIQDSADNSSFTDLTGGGFTQITSGTPQTQRIATSAVQAVRRYIRAVTVTTGGFSSLTFAVMIAKNVTAVSF
jgi:hypothetical protein